MKFLWFTEYKSSLKALEIEEFFDLVFYRPLGFLVVKAVAGTKITPNQLTYTALFFGIIAGISFSFGTKEAFLLGALSYLLFDVFDCSDGQLARLKKNGTLTGRIIDGVADYLAGIAVYIGIGIGYVAGTENFILWLALLIIAAGSHIIHSMITDYYRQRFIRYGFGEKNLSENRDTPYKEELLRLRQQGGSVFNRAILAIYLAYSSRQSKMTRSNLDSEEELSISPSVYYQKNVVIMRLWTFLGPTTQITFLVVSALFYRPDIYIIGMIAGFNLLAIILFIFQQIIDHQTFIKLK